MPLSVLRSAGVSVAVGLAIALIVAAKVGAVDRGDESGWVGGVQDDYAESSAVRRYAGDDVARSAF
jgi:hypothetical protein